MAMSDETDIATKEMIMSFMGAIMRASNQPFNVGEWVTIDGVTLLQMDFLDDAAPDRLAEALGDRVPAAIAERAGRAGSRGPLRTRLPGPHADGRGRAARVPRHGGQRALAVRPPADHPPRLSSSTRCLKCV